CSWPRLKPFTSYKFRVKATNDIGDSEYSQESESLTTLQAAPEEAPTILSVTPHTTTSVLIRWQPPTEDKLNGILLGFRIRYRELVYDGLRSFTTRSVTSPGAKWTELTRECPDSAPAGGQEQRPLGTQRGAGGTSWGGIPLAPAHGALRDAQPRPVPCLAAPPSALRGNTGRPALEPAVLRRRVPLFSRGARGSVTLQG
ncbi:sidekick cell adhesion molecule 2, partial [Chelydra serpentina]